MAWPATIDGGSGRIEYTLSVGSVTNTRLNCATGQRRSIVRSNKLWNDQSASSVSTTTKF